MVIRLNKPERIVVVGGGMAALTTVFELTSRPDWRERYDITVYQMGHRLGGKGASGRNQKRFDRIEEHGLHLFYGFYDNAFSVLRRCYEELGRPEGAPLRTLEDAFHPHSLVVFEEQRGGQWQHQPLLFPRNDERPGLGATTPTPAELIPKMLTFLLDLFDEQPLLKNPAATRSDRAALRLLRRGVAGLLGELGEFLRRPGDGLLVVRREAVLGRLLAFSRWTWRLCAPLLERRPDLRVAWTAVDVTLAMIRGMIADRLVEETAVDWLRLDHEDFRAWLRRHGASDEAVAASTVAGVYAGAYMADQEIGAGTALHWTLRMLYTYRGALFYKMQAGMGDVVFAPLYLVLRARGVKFRFFHRADALHLSADRSRVDEVVFGRQIAVAGDREYEPLYDVKGLPCWPSEPLYDQLEDGDALARSGEDLEDWGTRWPDAREPLVLRAGRDFDRVLLGIGLGAVPALCAEMIADPNNPRFAAMVRAVKTTHTASAQLWFRGDLASTGWQLPPPVMIPYAMPLDTWADMSHLLPRESFPGHVPAGSCAYLTAAMDDDEEPPIRREDADGYCARQTRRIRTLVEQHLRTRSAHLWPAAQKPGGGLDHRLLVSPDAGADPLDWQHFSPCLNPSDRYVRSIRGSTFHRLDAGASGYDNLVLCGDWTMNPMNLGCVEGATMSGIRAAQVISGEAIALHDDWLVARRPALRPPARERPRYIQRALNESTSPPYEARATAMYAAVLAADPERLADLCARHLGLNPERCYLPLGPSVVFYAQHNHALSAVDAPGVVPERDFGFLVPVAVCERRAGKLTPVGVAVYMPYLWVDLGAAILGGREVLGFPKGQATLGFPTDPTGAVELRVDAWMPPATGRSGAWREERLLDARLDGSARSRVRSLADALRSGFDPAWLASRGVDLAGQLRLLRALTLTLRTGGLRMVFLKQYRDAAACDRACYQAIVEAPCTRAGAPRVAAQLPGALQLRILRRSGLLGELGLRAEGGDPERARVPALATFYTELDFTIGAADVVWAA